MKQTNHRKRGFTIIELLLVVGVIVVIISLIVPAVQGFLQAQRLSATTANLAGGLGEAQQLAQSSNRWVEVRFLSYDDPQIPGTTATYHAYQIFERQPSGVLLPLRQMTKFDTGIILSSNPEFTTLINEQGGGASRQQVPGPQDPEVPEVGRMYKYFTVQFLPGGTTSLSRKPTDRWCMTLIQDVANPTQEQLPANFATIQVDPHNGSIKLLRP